MPQGQGPTYQRIVDGLRKTIAGLGEGDRLPSVREISKRHNVPVGTASRAINELRAAGLVEARRGAGIFVRRFRAIPRSSPKRLSHRRWDAGHAIQDADTPGRSRVVDVQTGETRPPEWAVGPLGVQSGDPVAYRSRRFIVDDRPVQLAISYLPVDIVRGTQVMHTDTGPGGSYARLAELGHGPVRFTEYLRARMPYPDETEALSLPAGTPVVEITRHAFDAAGRCVEVNRMVLDGMAYLLDYSFDAT